MSDVQTMSWQPPDNDQSFLRQDLKVTGWPVHRNGNEWRRRRACYGWNLIRSLPLSCLQHPSISFPSGGSTAQRIVGQILPIYLQIYLPAHIDSELPKVLFKVLFWALFWGKELFWALFWVLLKVQELFWALFKALFFTLFWNTF